VAQVLVELPGVAPVHAEACILGEALQNFVHVLGENRLHVLLERLACRRGRAGPGDCTNRAVPGTRDVLVLDLPALRRVLEDHGVETAREAALRGLPREEAHVLLAAPDRRLQIGHVAQLGVKLVLVPLPDPGVAQVLVELPGVAPVHAEACILGEAFQNFVHVLGENRLHVLRERLACSRGGARTGICRFSRR